MQRGRNLFAQGNRTCRRLQTESQTNSLKKRCPHFLDGCRLHFDAESDELNDHLKECPFGLIVCPSNGILGSCTWKGNIKELKLHFKSDHTACCELKPYEQNILPTGQNYQILYLLEKGQSVFLLHMLIERQTRILLVAVQLVGTKKSAEKWMFKLRISSENKSRKLLEITEPCYSHVVSFDTLRLEKKTAIINLDYTDTYTENKELTYKIFLMNLDHSRGANPRTALPNRQK